MDGVLTQKTISFLGSWKCNRISDHLLHEIGSHSNRIKGSTTKFQVSKAGVNLIAVDGSGQLGKSTLIPLSNIYNVTVNRFKPECLLCVVRDEPRRLSVLVCRCKSEKDITDIIQSFNSVKRSQSGEGYNTNIRKFSGQNWSLNTRQDVQQGYSVNFSNGDESKYETSQNGNRSFQSGTTVTNYNKGDRYFKDTAVQTDAEEDLDSASSMSSASVKEELLHLSQDVRAIKRMLELSTAISDAQHFKRTSQPSQNGQQIKYEEVPVFYSKSQDQVFRSKDGKNKGRDVVVKGRSTKIIPDHDIRSFAVQTENKSSKDLTPTPGEVSAFSYGNASYIQQPVSGSVSSTSSSVPGIYDRQRIGSNSSTSSDAVFLQYQRSPDIIGVHDKIGRVSHFITPPPGDRSKSLQVRHYSQKDQRASVAVMSTTVPRSIENVYSGKRYKKNRQEKARVVVTPKTFLNGDILRKSSDSEKNVLKGDQNATKFVKGGSDSSLDKKGNSLQEKNREKSENSRLRENNKEFNVQSLSKSGETTNIDVGETSENVILRQQNKEFNVQQLSKSQETANIDVVGEKDNENLNRESMSKIESRNYVLQTQEPTVVSNIIQRSESTEKEHTIPDINGDADQSGIKRRASIDRSSAESNTVLFREPEVILITNEELESVSKTPNIATKQSEDGLTIETGAFSSTANNTESISKTYEEVKEKSGNHSNVQSEVFYITEEDLESACKIPYIPREYNEVDSDPENSSEEQDLDFSMPETPDVVESNDTPVNLEFITDTQHDEVEAPDNSESNVQIQ